MIIVLLLAVILILSFACISGEGDESSSRDLYYTENYTTATSAGNSSGVQNLFISINPVTWSKENQILNVTGTTNFPTCTEITISSKILVHSCPTRPPGPNPDTGGIRTLCNGCSTEIEKYQVYAVSGPGENNTWSCHVNTSGWCIRESYYVRAGIDAGNETIQDTKEFRFSG